MKKSTFIMIISICLLLLAGCGAREGEQRPANDAASKQGTAADKTDDANTDILLVKSDPLWTDPGSMKLALTGHMHFPYITEAGGLWEILSGMPFSGKHLMGSLAVGGGRMVYFAEPIDFAAYGNAVKEELDRLDRESAEYMEQVFGELLDLEGVRGAKKKKVLKLIGQFLSFYQEGTLAEHAQEIRDDPSYELMIRALWNYNYGPWMKDMLETTKYNGVSRGRFY